MSKSSQFENLFDAAASVELERHSPLSARMRPKSLDDVVGQSHLIAPGAPFRSLVDADRLSSAIFFGPPGTGKTTVARLVSEVSKKAFVPLSAVSAGVRDVREVLDNSRRLLGEQGRGTILFLDEIHRFSRSQQDALLPGVEDGTVVLVGATTENPFFSLNGPLLSRSTLWRFELLTQEELGVLVGRAANLEQVTLTDEAIEACCELADGDGRAALTTLEVAIAIARAHSDLEIPVVDLDAVHAARTTRAIRHGRDEHYDLLSAFIKSMRGSDPDAALYWFARLIAAGEDPRLIARRMVILASEDIGMADPNALIVATAAAAAVEQVGLPEVGLNLAQAVVHLCLAPKSNRTALALWAAQDDVEHAPLGAVPHQLRDAHYPGAAKLGHGTGYEYPHDDPRGYVETTYLPDELADRTYYTPSSHGFEKELADRMAKLHGVDRETMTDEQSEGHTR